jgi:hypothetical protein
VTKENARLKFATSVDGSAWGAPLISPLGVIGVIESQSIGITWEDIQRALPVSRAMP